MTSAGWRVERLAIPAESLEFDEDDHRALRAWRFLPEGGPHVLIDADSGSLLYLEAFCFADEAGWILSRPQVAVSREHARAIVETLTASQYGAFSPRVFQLVRTRTLDKWPVWDLEFLEAAEPRRFLNEVSVMVDWNTGQVLEYVASNIEATYEGTFDPVSAQAVAVRHWNDLHDRKGVTGTLRGIQADVKIRIGEKRRVFPAWLFKIDSSCVHDSNLHGTHHNVLIDGASGEILGWGGVTH